MDETIRAIRNVEEGDLAGAPVATPGLHAANLPVRLLALLAAEAAAFVLLSASGNMPEIVFTVFRALLTL